MMTRESSPASLIALQHLDAVHVLHVEIEQDHVRLQLVGETNALAAAGRLADEPEFRCGLHQLDHTLAEQWMVIDDQDALGILGAHVKSPG
jgi:hypothetical protein